MSHDFEEEFHGKACRKEAKKERKIAERTDRSKHKKTDRDKVVKEDVDAGHLPLGLVVGITGEGMLVEKEERVYLCTLKGALKKEKLLAKNLIAVGDFVRFMEEEKSIVAIEERTSILARTDITGKKEQLIAVNVDQVIICVALPSLKAPLVDRYLIAAEKGRLHPVIVINKIDLLEDVTEYQEFLAAYERLGIPVLSISSITGVGIEALRSLLQNKTSVFSGQSGVGKSSLLNVAFGLKLKTGEMTAKTQKGRHTTTVAELIRLPGGGHIVDTPGIRSFGIWNFEREDLFAHYRDLQAFGRECKYPDCTHREEPACRVKEALDEGKISRLRYESYKSLLENLLEGKDKQTWS